VANLRASLERVIAEGVADTMAVQKYDIRRPETDGGGFEERHWSPVNSPVLDAAGGLVYIVHRVEDVTEFVRLAAEESEQQRRADALLSRTAEMEAEVYRRAQEIADANRELQRANLDLRRSQIFLDSVIENIPHMVFVKDATTLRFVRLNRAGEALLGVPRSALIGKTDHDLFPAAQADFFTAKDREVLSSDRVVDVPEEEIETAHHGTRILHTKKIPIRDETGQPRYLLGISEDVTERKQADAQLRAARLEADRANLAKTEFLSRMSHELRTPLNAILGFSQLLQLDGLDPAQRENVDYIERGGHHLLDLINEILDISRIESGQMMLSPEPVDLGDVVREVVDLIRPLAAARRIQIDDRGDGCGCHVLADRQRLTQVLLNLLSNAVKYNRDGGSVTVRCATADPGRVRISVADTGYGIPREYLDRVFQPFDRLGAERGPVEGTGMGLALSKGLVEAMGGTMAVDSRLDAGSTFSVELTLAEGPVQRYERTRRTRAPLPAGGSAARLVLQIEDNASNRRLVERIVDERPAVRLIEAATAEAGLALARKQLPDLILLDLHLPDMAGHEVLRHLRSYPETRDLPVVVVSADATKGQIASLIALGAWGYLTKPLDVAEFLAMLDKVLDQAPASG
jgi:PAS domain S-box-containing protein